MRRHRRSGAPPRRLTPRRLTLAGLALLGLSVPASTLAADRAPRAAPATVGRVALVQIGPLDVGRGEAVTLQDLGCGAPDATLSIIYTFARAHVAITHSFLDAGASCVVLDHGHGLAISDRRPGPVDIDLVLRPSGRMRRPATPSGCGALPTAPLSARISGTLGLAIRPDRLGRLSLRPRTAEIVPAPAPRCPAPAPTRGEALTAVIGAEILDADAPRGGPAALTITTPVLADAPGGLLDTRSVTFTGAAAMGEMPHRATVRLGATTALSQGSLSFTALPPCPGARAVNGTLAGELTLDDPLAGPAVLSGAEASLAYAGPEGSRPGGCNGLGSEPLAPDLVSTCPSPDVGCSVSAVSNTVTLFDETSPGTQTVTAESIDFGDGSAPQPLAPATAVSHLYAQPGSYTATLTVTDAAGTTATATAPVVVGP